MSTRIKAEDVEPPIEWKLEQVEPNLRELKREDDDGLSEVDTESEDEEKVAWEIIKKYENPKLEVKKELLVPIILATQLQRILDGIGFYDFNSVPAPTNPVEKDREERERDTPVSREFMSKFYGGNMIATFPSLRTEFMDKHHYRNFMYLNKDFNPSAPTVAGNPGLFFSSDRFWLQNVDARPGDDANFPEWSKVPMRVFTRLSSNTWQYVGQYKLAFCRAITVQEWKEQLPEATRKTWVVNIAEREWATVVRTRLLLKDQLGRKPTVAEVDAEVQRVEGEVQRAKGILRVARQALKERLGHKPTQKEEQNDLGVQEAKEGVKNVQVVTQERIRKAFEEGEEFILIWEMKCVHYDKTFQHEVVTEFESWSRSRSSSESKKKNPTANKASGQKSSPKKSSTTKSSTKKTSSSPRKRNRDDDDDDDDYMPSLPRASAGQTEVLERPKRARRNRNGVA